MAMKISVVIPAFNATATLAETLDSIEAQLRPPDEVIVVDDGSTDDTQHIARSHKLAPIVLTQSNGGAATAINAGIANSTGDLISFLDADDLWLPSKLQVQERALSEDRTLSGVLGHSEAFECPSIPKHRFDGLNYVRGVTPGYLIGTLLVRKDYLRDELAQFDASLITGYFIDWFRKAKSDGMNFQMVDELVLKRRIRPSTLSARRNGSGDGLSRDFIEIARRALAEKRRMRGQS